MDKEYNTLSELKAAYERGELDQNRLLIIDNDSTAVYSKGYYSKLFEGGTPSRLLEEALTLLGIPWDNA